jgi:hypothetical protein
MSCSQSWPLDGGSGKAAVDRKGLALCLRADVLAVLHHLLSMPNVEMEERVAVEFAGESAGVG